MAPKKKASKKAPSVGLRGKKKSVPPAAGLRPKKEKLFRLEVGKTYVDGDGDRLKVIAASHSQDYPYTARDRKGLEFHFTADGRFVKGNTSIWDLVREVVKRRGK